MSNKIKSSLYLSCFLLAFTVYSFSTPSENNFSDSTEIAIAEIDEITPSHSLQIEDPK